MEYPINSEIFATIFLTDKNKEKVDKVWDYAEALCTEINRAYFAGIKEGMKKMDT